MFILNYLSLKIVKFYIKMSFGLNISVLKYFNGSFYQFVFIISCKLQGFITFLTHDKDSRTDVFKG